jgi:quercetin dioxygenase-like cupin family protein
MKKLLILVCLSGMMISSCAQKKRSSSQSDSHTIFSTGTKVTSNNFTGNVHLKMLMGADSINPTSVGNVTFEPGARTKWHLHPGGQILLVTDEVGYYQEKGQAKQILRKGDVIKCPANLPHWHGASADTAFVQVAITNRHLGETVWLHEVSDDEYNK